MKIVEKVKINVKDFINKRKSETPTTDKNSFSYFTLDQLESYSSDLKNQIRNIKEKIMTVSSEKRKELEEKLKALESILDDITKSIQRKKGSIENMISQNKKRR